MMWDLVMIRILAIISADTVLSGIFGDNVRAAGSSKMVVPSIEYTLLADLENELWAPFEIQFDLWTKTAADSRDAERHMRIRFHRDLPILMEDVKVWSLYNGGSALAAPDRAGYTGRALRFNFTPLRAQYADVVTP